MAHHSFDNVKACNERAKTTAEIAIAADNAGSHADRMSNERFIRFADLCSAHSEASERMFVANWHVANATEYDCEYDSATMTWKRVNERTPFIRIACSADSQAMTKHGKHTLTDRPMRHADDALRATSLQWVGHNDIVTMGDVANLRRDMARRQARKLALHYGDLRAKERSGIAMSSLRAHGHNASSLRYVNDALISARMDDDALSIAIFVAVLTAGTWAIIAPMPANKCAPSRRNDPPCNGLADWIAEPYANAMRTMPQRVIAEHIRNHLRDYADND